MFVFDVHTHLGEGKYAKSTELGLINSLEKAGVSKAVVFPIKSSDKGIQYSKANKKIISFYKKHPELIIPFARFEPEFNKSDLKKYEEIKGIKIHLRNDKWSINELHRLLSNIEGTELIIIFHSDKEIIKQVSPLIKEFSNINFIAAHAQVKGKYWELFKDYKNLFYDTSIKTSPFTLKTLASIDDSRILFGSDYPFSTPLIESTKIKLCPEDYLSERSKEKILGLNAKKLFKIKE